MILSILSDRNTTRTSEEKGRSWFASVSAMYLEDLNDGLAEEIKIWSFTFLHMAHKSPGIYCTDTQ